MSRKRRGRGEGSVYRRADGRWVGVLSLGADGSGRRKRVVVYAASKTEALEKLRRVQADADAGRLAEADRLTVGEYLRRWLDHTAKNRVRDATWERYRQLVELYLTPILGGVGLARLTPLHVEQCYADMGRRGASAWTRRIGGVVLSAALKHAVRLGLIPANPAAGVAKARPIAREMLFLTGRQARLLLDAARPHRLHALFALAVGTGMRQGELLALQWADVDLDRATVEVKRSLSWVRGKPQLKEPKSAAGRRTVVLPKFAVDALRDHRRAAAAAGLTAAPVFCTRTGTHIGKHNLGRQVFRPLLRRANALAAERAREAGGEPDLVPAGLRFHDLRHTHATALVAAGHSVKAVSRRLGHAGIEITLRVYAHLMPNDDEKLAGGADALFG